MAYALATRILKAVFTRKGHHDAGSAGGGSQRTEADAHIDEAQRSDDVSDWVIYIAMGRDGV